MRNYWSLKLSDCGRILFLIFLSTNAFAQLSEEKLERTAKAEKYVFPIRPGTPASLAGTMGELRNTHFHSGIDIRTNNEIGWPVVAAKSGYISRVSVSGSGYGNVIYVKHDDGNSTLYGHLDSFYDKLGDYVLLEQYRRKSFNVDLYFRDGQFSVQQGDTIAFGGNTGSSGGPHLHFDIRDSKFDALDPLQFDFTEVKDLAPPIAQKIALKTLDIDSRINDQFGRFEYYLLRSGTNFKLNYPIMATGRIGIELLGYDRIDTYRYKMGINYIDLYVNNQHAFNQAIEKIDISETRSIYALMDYRTLYERGSRFYKLYIDEGNRQGFYSKSPGAGFVEVNPSKPTDIKIVMKDVFGNSSEVNFQLKPVPLTEEVKTLGSIKETSIEIQKNILIISSNPCQKTATIYVKNISHTIKPSYSNNLHAVYLLDLRKTMPDSIKICDETLVTNFQAMIPSATAYKYYSDWADIQFPNKSLFDTTYFQASHTLTADSIESFNIGNSLTPLNRYIRVSLNPTLNYPKTKNVAAYRKAGNSFDFAGGEWRNGRFDFYTRTFGEYRLLIDTVPPVISRIYVNSTVARFKIRDYLSGISDWEATIDGEWLMMSYDAKTATLRSEKLNKEKPLKGEFKLVVTDNAGNKEVYTQTIY